MSMNASIIQIGTMVGVAIGGFVIETTGGYALIGSIYGLTLVLAALLLIFFVVETEVTYPSRIT
jgi:predicted MFS family arabinose efflux permease